ncbi:unnamed protein product [Durusdinium trenchii]|uniref:Uncharacterized protein n=1 Tax=Durusdinium trenchii TaxID=1381693 RepID=A0ABP0RCA5_9DINO
MRHSIEERLSEAVKALLKEQPADPTAFLCKQLTDWDQVTQQRRRRKGPRHRSCQRSLRTSP